MIHPSFKASLESWVQARQALERLPRLPQEDFLDLIIHRSPEWLIANVHEVEVLEGIKGMDDEAVLLLFDEMGVPASIRVGLMRRRQARQVDHHIFTGDQGQEYPASTWHVPFGLFAMPDDGQDLNPNRVDGARVIQTFLDDINQWMVPVFHLIRQSSLSQSLPIGPSITNMRLMEALGWPQGPYVTWPNDQLMSRIPFQGTALQAGLLSLPLLAENPVALGVVEDMVIAAIECLSREHTGFFKILGAPLPRLEATEEATVAMGVLWARMVFCATARSRGNAEFVFEKGQPHRLYASLRVKDTPEGVSAMFNHHATFQDEASLARILAPWMTTQASHLAWQLSTAHAANYTEQKLAGPQPFW